MPCCWWLSLCCHAGYSFITQIPEGSWDIQIIERKKLADVLGVYTPPRTHTNIIAVCKKKAKNCFKVLLILLLPLLKLWLIRQETSSLTVTTRWTVRRISMQQAPSLNTADLWTCMRLVSSTLLPKAPLTNPSIFWYTLPFPPLLLNSMI